MIDLAPETLRLVDAAWRRGLAPEPQIPVSAWADRHRRLPDASAEPGPWRTARVPYLAEIMDCLSTASPIERVVLMKGSQVAGTEAALNALGYWIDHAPGSILVVWPTDGMVRLNSRKRVDPLIASTPALRGKVAERQSRSAANTMTMKEFPGGDLVMVGANSPVGLRSQAIRYLVMDEVDAFPVDVGEEGDPLKLAEQRTVTYRGRRKIFLLSTPTIAGVSRIERAYEATDQRRYFVPCPHCGTHQVLTWSGIRWPEGAPRAAFYACADCGGVIEERQQPALLAAGEWRPTATGEHRTRGYHLSALYSPFEAWGDIAAEFLDAKADPVLLKSWTNLKLGEPWEDRDTAPLSADSLAARAEDWGEDLPDGVAVITAGVDVQDDRLELEVVGWGLGEESWSLDYRVIHGDTSRPEPWAALDRILSTRYRHPRAVPDLPIAAVAIDSGGHRTSQVMTYSAARLNRRIWAIKGRGGPGVPIWPKRPPKPKRAAVAPLHIVGVDQAKHTLFGRLRAGQTAGPGACHFPDGRDHDWFAGLVAERAIRRYVRGVAKLEYKKDPAVRNEPLDCRVYASAAIHGLFAAGLRLDEERNKIQSAPNRENDKELSSPARLNSVNRSKWMDR